MDYGSHYYRKAHWVKIIQACQNRPSDITAKQWLKDNGISDKSYYYWLKKLKTEKISQAKQSLPARDYNAGDISFVEVSDAVFGEDYTLCPHHDVMAKIRIGNAEIELMDSISDDFLYRILKAARYAC